MATQKMTPNMCVAHNLRRARRHRGWTQEQAAEQLEPHIGARWSKAVFSAAERSVSGERVRHFTADDLYAFSRAFNLPVDYFLCPPPWAEEMEIGHADSDGTASLRGDYLNMLFDVGEEASEWLLGEVVPMEAGTTAMLRRWRDHLAAVVDYREREVARFITEEGS